MTTHHEVSASKRTAKDQEEDIDNTEDEGDDEDGVYEVERVVGHRRDPKSRTMAYFLKWVNYPHEDNTWEVEDQVFCTDLVSEYWQRHLERGGSKDDLYAEEGVTEKKQPKRGGKSVSAAGSSTKANGATRGGRSLLPEVPPLGSSKAAAGTSRRKEKASQEEAPSNKRQKTAPAAAAAAAATVAAPAVAPTPPKPSWTPPSNWTSWEDHVLEVRDVERRNDNLIVHLAWKLGHETIHDREQVHTYCPRKLLKFYEDHLKFREA